jgi:phage tail-like protein
MLGSVVAANNAPRKCFTLQPDLNNVAQIERSTPRIVSERQVKSEIMPGFSANPQRSDPYKNFKFRLKWNGRYVAGMSRLSVGPAQATEIVKYREGGDSLNSRKSPGRTKYDSVTLERGATQDTEFGNWANKVRDFGAGLGSEVSPKDFRKDIILEFYNEAGQLTIAYKLYRCWVSEYSAMPGLDANANAVAIQHIKLENEGWERDYAEPRLQPL